MNVSIYFQSASLKDLIWYCRLTSMSRCLLRCFGVEVEKWNSSAEVAWVITLVTNSITAGLAWHSFLPFPWVWLTFEKNIPSSLNEWVTVYTRDLPSRRPSIIQGLAWSLVFQKVGIWINLLTLEPSWRWKQIYSQGNGLYHDVNHVNSLLWRTNFYENRFRKKQASRFLFMMKRDTSFSKVQFVKMDFKTICRIKVLIKKWSLNYREHYHNCRFTVITQVVFNICKKVICQKFVTFCRTKMLLFNVIQIFNVHKISYDMKLTSSIV